MFAEYPSRKASRPHRAASHAGRCQHDDHRRQRTHQERCASDRESAPCEQLSSWPHADADLHEALRVAARLKLAVNQGREEHASVTVLPAARVHDADATSVQPLDDARCELLAGPVFGDHDDAASDVPNGRGQVLMPV
jgi:hypothetical protein